MVFLFWNVTSISLCHGNSIDSVYVMCVQHIHLNGFMDVRGTVINWWNIHLSSHVSITTKAAATTTYNINNNNTTQQAIYNRNMFFPSLCAWNMKFLILSPVLFNSNSQKKKALNRILPKRFSIICHLAFVTLIYLIVVSYIFLQSQFMFIYTHIYPMYYSKVQGMAIRIARMRNTHP